MENSIGNLYEAANPPALGESFDVLLRHQNLIIERISSSSTLTPTEYVQVQDEWVLLVQGEAELLVDGTRYRLTAGDYLFIPAHTPHSVLQTTEGALWLAVHLYATASAVPNSSE